MIKYTYFRSITVVHKRHVVVEWCNGGKRAVRTVASVSLVSCHHQHGHRSGGRAGGVSHPPAAEAAVPEVYVVVDEWDGPNRCI